MDRLICAACGTEVGADEVVCPECRAVLTTGGAVRAGPAEEPAAAPVAPTVVVPAAAPDAGCPYCGAGVDPSDLVCLRCLRELSPTGRTGAPPSEAALRTTLERPVTAVQLRFESGVVEVRAGQEVTLGRAPRHTDSAPRLAGFDNVSRTHATVGVTADGAVWLRDEGSANGTWADGVPVPRGQVRPLRDGSVIRLASNVTARVRLRNDPARD